MFDKYSHKYVREYVTASTILKEDRKYLELNLRAQNLYAEANNADIDLKIVPISDYRHHNTYVRRSYIQVQYICCHPLLLWGTIPT